MGEQQHMQLVNTPGVKQPTSWFLQGESAEEKSAKAAAKREAKMQSVLRALGVLASTSGVTAERQTFMNLVTAPAVSFVSAIPCPPSPPSARRSSMCWSLCAMSTASGLNMLWQRRRAAMLALAFTALLFSLPVPSVHSCVCCCNGGVERLCPCLHRCGARLSGPTSSSRAAPAA
jgi:hypothetical protein